MDLAATRTPAMCAALIVLVTFAGGGCRDANREDLIQEQPQLPVDDRPEATMDIERDYASELGVDLGRMERDDSGVYYEDVVVGEGDAAEVGRHVEVHYTSWLPDGTRLVSTHDAGVTEEFVLGTGAVIVGWEEGMVGMRGGGRRRLVIPPALAYGRDGYGTVPPYATLIIDVELVAVQ
jgi:FKBP-type peptidyl-prolyl cis-trans isomerase FkpA